MASAGDALRRARSAAARLLGRGRPEEPHPDTVRLEDVRRRLELLVAAVHGRPIPIVAAEPPRPPSIWHRVLLPPPAHLRHSPAPLPASDGERIHLPPELDRGGADAAERYRVLALAQAERLARGTRDVLPPRADPLVDDLYLLAESAAADAGVARSAPGLRAALKAERALALQARPPLEGMHAGERAVEARVREVLAADPGSPPAWLPPPGDPARSLEWARAQAEELRGAGKYRGVAQVAAWGRVLGAMDGPRGIVSEALGQTGGPSSGNMGQGGSGKQDSGMQADARDSTPWDQGDASAGESVDDEQGQATAGDESPPTEDDRAGAAEGEDAGDDEQPPQAAVPAAGQGGGDAAGAAPRARALRYPEWDWRTGAWRRPGAAVRIVPAVVADTAWADWVLAEHRGLVRRLREQFERLRARRTRLPRQRDGEELDLEACVAAMVDLRAGRGAGDRLYQEVRPARRELSILLLLDVSGSTTEHVGATRIIDVEKAAVVLAAEAFDALGDAYAVLTFSGQSVENVRMRIIKDFAERNGAEVRGRISALQPEGYTRLGAAVRHGTALLSKQGTAHQLLLILSDGKPDDDDAEYGGRYGVEDSRQAIAEARAAGIFPFCLTVDRKGSAYLTRIFGAAGHVILRHPEQLPVSLAQVVRHLLTG